MLELPEESNKAQIAGLCAQGRSQELEFPTSSQLILICWPWDHTLRASVLVDVLVFQVLTAETVVK